MPLPRRRLLFSLLLAPVVTAAAGQDAPPDTGGERFDASWSAEAHYREAVRLLNRGVNFERAILHARAAATKDAANPSHHLALGCACASRAAALVYAATFTRMHGQMTRVYERALARHDSEADPEAERPVPPPPGLSFPTKDDRRPFALAPAALDARLGRLFGEAKSAFEAAGERAAALPDPERRAEAQYVRGWGILTLRLYANLHETVSRDAAAEDEREGGPVAPPPSGPLPRPPLAGAVDAFREATELAPENAAYWQSLGDALEAARGGTILAMLTAGPGPDGAGAEPGAEPGPEGAEVSAARKISVEDAYRKSLSLHRRNVGLWCKMAQFAAENEEPPASGVAASAATVTAATVTPAKPRTTRQYRDAAVRADPAAAILLYQLAAAQLEGGVFLTHARAEASAATSPGADSPAAPPAPPRPGAAERRAIQEALRLVERGNLAARLYVPRYLPWTPKTLAAAWDYVAVFVFEPAPDLSSQVQFLGAEMGGYAAYCARQGDAAESRRALRALHAMAQRLIGDWPLRDAGRNTGEVDLCAAGLELLETVLRGQEELCRARGDEAGAEAASRDLAALQARQEAWEKVRAAEAREEYLPFFYY